MRSSDQLTAIINRAVATLEACGYSVCNTARTAVDARVPCCTGDGCGAWTVTGGITRQWPATGEGKCAYIPGFVIKLTVARCIPSSTGELPDDEFAADAVDVLDCLHAVWTCDAKATLGWMSLVWVATDRVAHGVCAGWTVTLHGSWMLG